MGVEYKGLSIKSLNFVDLHSFVFDFILLDSRYKFF